MFLIQIIQYGKIRLKKALKKLKLGPVKFSKDFVKRKFFSHDFILDVNLSIPVEKHNKQDKPLICS